MLRCCELFAFIHGLKFKHAKTQLIKFSMYAASSPTHPFIKFCGLPHEFSNTVVRPGNILLFDLNDSEDILLKCRDMLTKFNAVLSCFPNPDPTILTYVSILLSFSSRIRTVEYLINNFAVFGSKL